MSVQGWFSLFSMGALAAACGGGPSMGGDDDGQSAADASAPGEEPDASVPPEEEEDVARFVVMGDTGEGNEDQSLVADVIEQKCAADGCDFVVLLGDNIYDSGVDSVDDPQWQAKFEEPYADLDLPFYAVLGNHDYGGELAGVDAGGIGNEWDKGPLEVEYSQRSDKWIMPDTHYTFTVANVGFIMLDTNSILWDDTTHGDQREWYQTALMEVSGADWVFAAGHHPYLSNGAHGNAGSYESVEIGSEEIPNPLPVLNGNHVEDFLDEVVCGTVDVYFAGHDHNRQWLDEPDAFCGAELIVSGAGAKVKDFDNTERNQVFFQDASTEGFLWVEVEGDRFTGEFYDKNGQMNYERTLTR